MQKNTFDLNLDCSIWFLQDGHVLWLNYVNIGLLTVKPCRQTIHTVTEIQTSVW